jgi:Protein of unknown function (DUF3307)
MAWVEVFAVFVVCHLVGDYLLQTEWQALNKRGGLGSDRVKRRALVSHIVSYTLAFVPAFVWLAEDLDALAIAGVVAGVALPHLVQDDGRLLARYMDVVKKAPAAENASVLAAVDQSFHVVTLLLLALAAGN